MAFLFGRNRQRSAQDLVKSSKELLQKLLKEEGQNQKVNYAGQQSIGWLCMLTAELDGRRPRPHVILDQNDTPRLARY